jgi:hypothetical protein
VHFQPVQFLTVAYTTGIVDGAGGILSQASKPRSAHPSADKQRDSEEAVALGVRSHEDILGKIELAGASLGFQPLCQHK